MKKITICILSLIGSSFLTSLRAQESRYERPPREIEEVALAKVTPVSIISNDSKWIVQLERSPYRSLARLAQPELKIAGTRINPATFSVSRQAEYTGATLLETATQKRFDITGLPAEGIISNASFSPDKNNMLLFVEEPDGMYVYRVENSSNKAEKINGLKVNATSGVEILWINDDEFLTLAVPRTIGKAPEKPLVPSGPVIQENIGKATPARTYQDLLKNPYDEELFDYYFTSQLVRVSPDGIKEIGSPAIYGYTLSLSPDKSLLLTSTILRPYSYQVPMYSFAQTYTVTDLEGKTIKTLAENPVINLPMGYDVSSPYPRSYNWRPDKPATLYWVEAQDEGDPRKNKVKYKDIVYQWTYPFSSDPEEVVRTENRFRTIQWHSDQLALVSEVSRETRRMKTWQFKPASKENPVLLYDLSTDDNYNNPGNPVMVRNEYGRYVLHTNKALNELLMLSSGASPEGDMPYISRLNLKTKKNDILWRCQAPYYEQIIKVSDPAKLLLITSRQSVTEPANLFVRDLKRNRITQLIHNPNPYPSMEGVTKEKIHYKRADGLALTATVYLPAGYDKEKDGRLPVLMWAYPREYRSTADAGQVRGSKYTFTNINYGSPVYWVLRGYCIMDNVEMPIVSTTEGAEPNDNFIEQLVMNAEAAIKTIDEMGVGDPERVAVGGHSYGAFMTANLMTHTTLFKAGIARSGAYNRTLTPFGFQAETRTYWEAPEVYNTMSPFMHANQLSGALLLIHGEMDNNTGTFPIQSERFYSALQGHGATTRYVVLPYESHGYAAEENILHLLYECDEWLNTYVKNAK